MSTEPISAIGEISVPPPSAVHVQAAQTAAAAAGATGGSAAAPTAAPNGGSEAAQAHALSVLEQLAAIGDPLAVLQLAQAEQRLTPIDAELLLPTPAEHLPGAHEAGKGDLIDIYD